jgi:hypothetical protein
MYPDNYGMPSVFGVRFLYGPISAHNSHYNCSDANHPIKTDGIKEERMEESVDVIRVLEDCI